MTGRKRVTGTIVLCAVGLALAFGTVKIARLYADKDALRAALADRIAHWTGGEVTIAGPTRVSGLINITLEAGDVRVGAGPLLPWVEHMRARTVRMAFDWRSLFWGPLELARLELVEPRIVLAETPPAPREAGVALGPFALLHTLQAAPAPQLAVERGTVVALAVGLPAFVDVNADIYIGSSGASSGSGAFRWRGETVAFSYTNEAPTTGAATARTPMRLSLASPSVTAKVEGNATITDDIQLEGEIELDIPRLRRLAHWLGLDMRPGPGLGAFRATGDVHWLETQIAFDRGDFELDGNRAAGSLTLEYGGPRVVAWGTLDLESLDLGQYFRPASVPDSEWTAGDGRLDLTFLRDVDIDLRLSTARINAAPLTMGETALTIVNREGALGADFSTLALCGGTASGRIEANVADEEPQLRLAGTVSDLAAKPCIDLFGEPSMIEGTATLALDIESRGQTLQQLLARLDGTANVEIADGTADIDVAKILTLARTGELKGWEAVRGASSDFNRLTADCTARAGIAQCHGMEVRAGAARITGGGRVDLGGRRLDWHFYVGNALADRMPQMRQLLPSFSDAVVVSGSWLEPTVRITSDTSGHLDMPGKTPPASERAAAAALEGQILDTSER